MFSKAPTIVSVLVVAVLLGTLQLAVRSVRLLRQLLFMLTAFASDMPVPSKLIMIEVNTAKQPYRQALLRLKLYQN